MNLDITLSGTRLGSENLIFSHGTSQEYPAVSIIEVPNFSRSSLQDIEFMH
jgi:hypothetical protein